MILRVSWHLINQGFVQRDADNIYQKDIRVKSYQEFQKCNMKIRNKTFYACIDLFITQNGIPSIVILNTNNKCKHGNNFGSTKKIY